MKAYGAVTIGVYVVHKGAAETLEEFQSRALCLDVEVNVVACGRHISVDECLSLFVISMSADVNLLVRVVVGGIGK